MNNNDALQADNRIDAVQRRAPARDRTGKNTMLAARGGVDIDVMLEQNEESPLLDSSNEDESTDEDPLKPSWAGDDEWAGLPWYKRPSVYWLLGPFVFSALAFGGILVPKINLILSLICREYFADKSLPDAWQPFGFDKEIDPQCRTPAVQARVARFSLYGSLISGILSAIIAPRLGALSDRYGRRRIMMITNTGALSGEIITIFAATFPETFPVYWILFGFFFDGICGGMIASMALSHSYATDCTPPNKRNVVFGYFHGCMFTGVALGPMVAAYIIKWTGGVIVMFYIALGCHLFFIMLLIFVIPESLSMKQQMAARERHREMVEARGPSSDWISQVKSLNLLEPLKILYPTGSDSSPAVRRNLVLLAATDTIIFGVGTGAMTAVVLYSISTFVWDAYQQSIFVSVISSSRVICLLVVLPTVTRIFRGKGHSRKSQSGPQTGTDLFELSIIRVAIFFDILGFLGYALAANGNMFIASGAVASMGGIGSPTLQAALTKHVAPDRIGQLLGAMGLLHAFARVIAPAVFNELYARTVGHYDQAVFVVLTVLFSMAWVVSWLVKSGVRLEYVEDEYRRRRQSSIRIESQRAEDTLAI